MVVNVYMVRRSDQSRRNGTFRHINCHITHELMSIEFLLSSAFSHSFPPDPGSRRYQPGTHARTVRKAARAQSSSLSERVSAAHI